MAYQKVKPFLSVLSEDMKNAFQEYEVTQIDFDRIRPHPQNAQTYDPIDSETLCALKDNIKEVGLQQPLVVGRKDDGTYVIYSGHTRYTCISMIRHEDPGKFLKVPCFIVDREFTPAQEAVFLVTQNIQRVKSAADVGREIQVIRQAYDEMRAAGEDPGVSAMEFVTACTNLSKTSAYRYANISDNLTGDLLDRFNSGEISIKAADKIASMPESKQQKLAEEFGSEDKITDSMVASVTEKKKEPSISVSFTLSELEALFGPGKYTKKKLRELIVMSAASRPL